MNLLEQKTINHLGLPYPHPINERIINSVDTISMLNNIRQQLPNLSMVIENTYGEKFVESLQLIENELLTLIGEIVKQETKV